MHKMIQGRIIKVFSMEETRRITREWLQVFGKNRRGVYAEEYKWHIFSYERYPVLEGEEARREYALQPGGECILLPNDDDLPAVLLADKPDGCKLQDYYVFPANMAWVMAFTHEEGWLGPYFAKDLEKAEEHERKAREKLAAVQKGWALPDILKKS